MAQDKKQSFMKGAAILSASTLIVKMLGLLFSIPLANFIDPEGMSHFYNAYNIFGLFLMLSTAGLPVAVSRMVGTAYSQGRRREGDRLRPYFRIPSVFHTRDPFALSSGLNRSSSARPQPVRTPSGRISPAFWRENATAGSISAGRLRRVIRGSASLFRSQNIFPETPPLAPSGIW